MMTAHGHGLETSDERLTRIEVTKTLVLGTKLSMTTKRILEKMTDEQIINMFEKNIDTQYILLDYGEKK